MLYIITFAVIMILIFVNGFTDASNAITTAVSTRVYSFKKASFLSAIFNSIGIIAMSFVNFSVADCISSIVVLEPGVNGLIALSSSMFSVIIFSTIASYIGIPTSETHGLIAGLTGSSIVIGNISNINGKEWINVIIGLIWSVLGTLIIVKVTYAIFQKIFYKINIKKVIKYQKISLYILSFMHGAQDGQKFIGVTILFMHIVNGNSFSSAMSAYNCIWIIIFVSIIMFFGVSYGGKNIVQNVGNNTVKLDNVKGVFSDFGTAINLLIASLFGIPISTTHVKTMSIIALGNENTNRKNVSIIVKTWIWTFPVCFVLSFALAKIMIHFLV